MRRLEGRVALITGAASRIGRVTAERLAEEGAVVVVTDVQDEAGEQTAASIRDGGGDALYLRLDVTDETGWQAAVEHVLAERGRLDILVNNADWATSRRSRRRASPTGTARLRSTRPASSSA